MRLLHSSIRGVTSRIQYHRVCFCFGNGSGRKKLDAASFRQRNAYVKVLRRSLWNNDQRQERVSSDLRETCHRVQNNYLVVRHSRNERWHQKYIELPKNIESEGIRIPRATFGGSEMVNRNLQYQCQPSQ
jgi:hypothetical protein